MWVWLEAVLRRCGASLVLALRIGEACLITAMLLWSVPALALPSLTSTTVSTSSASVPLGSPVTFTATVSSAGGTPDGTVIFMVDLVSVGSTTLDASGQATFTSSTLPIGVHAVVAVYVGNLNFLASTSLSVNVNITLATCTINVAASAATVPVGGSVNLTATVTSSGGTPTGTIAFRAGPSVIGSTALNGSGQASFLLNTSVAGTLSIGADYGGDASHLPCTAPIIIITVTVVGGGSTATTTTLSSSSNPAVAGQPITFTAAVSAAAGTPSGQVTFRDGIQVIGSAQLSAGAAILAVSSLSVGAHSITAVYAGNATFAGSTSPALAQAISLSPDSVKLRNVQIVGSRIAAQNSGHAIASAIDSAIEEGFAAGDQIITPSELGLRLTSAGHDKRNFAPDWVVWSELRHTSLNPGSGQPDISGNQVNAFAGLTGRATPDLVAGIFAGYESFGYDMTSLSGHLRGDGITGGAYAGWRFLPGVRLDIGVAQSEIGYNGVSGGASGAFGGSRTLLTGAVSGTYKIARDFSIEPSARLFGLWETQSAYTDSLGGSQAQRSFFTGRASAGAKMTYSWLSPFDFLMTPYFGLYADDYFSKDTSTVSPTTLTALQGISARLVGGVVVTTDRNMRITTGGEVGGLGGSATVWSLRTRAAIPF